MSPAAEPSVDPQSAAEPWKPYLLALACYAGILGCVILLLPSSYIWAGHDSLSATLRTRWLADLWRAGNPGISPWLPDALYGYGYPMFHFYAPLSYAVSVGMSALLGIGAGTATKLSFYLSWLLAGVAAWGLAAVLLRRDRSPDGPVGSLAAALLYTFAPYHLCDIFSRGGLAECWAWTSLAALFWALEWCRANFRFGPFAVGAAWAALVLSHNIFALYGTILALLYVLLTVRDARWSLAVALGGLWGLFLSAYFWIPSLALLPWVHGHDPSVMLGSVEILKEHAMFPGQWLVGAYGRGGSTAYLEPDFPVNPGPELVAAALLSLVALFRPGLAPAQRRRVSACAALIALLVLVASPAMPWDRMPQMLRYLQFPWRLVLPVVLLGIIAAISAAPLLQRWFPPRILIAATLMLNLPGLYFLLFAPVSSEFTDATLLSEMRLRDEFETESAGSLALEYLPVGVNRDFGQPAWQAANPLPRNRLSPLAGDIQIAAFTRSGLTYQYDYTADTTAIVKLHVVFFPNWRLAIDGQPAPQNLFQTADGMIGLSLPAGSHTFVLDYGRSPIERFASALSLGALLSGAALFLLLYALRRRKFAMQFRPRWVAATAVIFLILLIAGELLLRRHIVRRSLPDPDRLGHPAPAHQYSHLMANQFLIADSELGHRLASNVRGNWMGAPVIIDHRGFRVDSLTSSHTLNLPTVRVATLGGSAMFGWGLKAGQGLPAQLRSHLISRLGQTAYVDLVNGAIPGATTEHQVAWAERAILPLNPDLIVLQHDLAERTTPFFFEDYRGSVFDIPWLIRPGKWAGDTLILQRLAAATDSETDTHTRIETQVRTQYASAAIERLAVLCRQNEIALVAVLTAPPGAELRNVRAHFVELFANLGVPVLEADSIVPQIEKSPLLSGKPLFLDKGPETHPTPLANEFTANALRTVIPRAIAGTRLARLLADAPASANLERPLDNELFVAPDSFHNMEDWAGSPVRWTKSRASLLAYGEGTVVKVKWWVGNPDVYTTRPLNVAVSFDGAKPVIHTFTESEKVGEAVHAIAPGAPRVVRIEIETDRLYFKPGDRRLLGVGLYPVTIE